MVLGQANPVEAELLDKAGAFDHALKRLGAERRIVGGRGHRPFARQVGGYCVAAGFKKRDLHCVVLPAAGAVQPVRNREPSIPLGTWRAEGDANLRPLRAPRLLLYLSGRTGSEEAL